MATRSASVRRDDLYHNLSLQHSQPADPFADGPAIPTPVRQATHPALQAARAAATANQGTRPAPEPLGDPAMPSAASGAHGTTSPSAYAQQFQTPTSFSDAPQRQQRHSRKPSLFRRSVVALTGTRMSHASRPSAAMGGAGGGLQRKPSALRKSMAWLLGPPPPVRVAPGIGDTPTTLETEKSSPGSKDGAYLGGGGDGNEWDVDGSGAAFWKRFSVAQRRAQDARDPLTMQSKEYVSGQKSANRKMRIGVYLSLVIIVALVVGLAVGIPAAHKHSDPSSSDSGDSAVNANASSNIKRFLPEPDLPTDLPGLNGAPGAAASAASASAGATATSHSADRISAAAAAAAGQVHASSQGRTHKKHAHRRAMMQVQAASQVAAA